MSIRGWRKDASAGAEMLFNLCVDALAPVGETQTPTRTESVPARPAHVRYSAEIPPGVYSLAPLGAEMETPVMGSKLTLGLREHQMCWAKKGRRNVEFKFRKSHHT